MYKMLGANLTKKSEKPTDLSQIQYDRLLVASAWTAQISHSDFFEPRTSTGSGLFALLSRDLKQIFGQIVRVKILINTNLVALRQFRIEKRLPYC